MRPHPLVFLAPGAGGGLRQGVNTASARAGGTAFRWLAPTVSVGRSLVMGFIVVPARSFA
jgi:hypothetical protein